MNARFQVLLAAGGVAAVDLALLDHKVATTFTTTPTFSMNCGAGGTVIACVQIYVNGTFTGCTIGGVSATRVALGEIASSTHCAIYIASGVPAGTQNVVVSLSGAGSQFNGCQLYSIANHSGLVPEGVASDVASPLTQSVYVPVGGAVIGTGMAFEGGTLQDVTWSWTGLSMDVDDSPQIFMGVSSASSELPAGNSALSVTGSPTTPGTLSSPVMALAVWGPQGRQATRTNTYSNYTGATSFSSVPIGTASTTRTIVVAVATGYVGGMTMTIDGVSATLRAAAGTAAVFSAQINTANAIGTITISSGVTIGGVYVLAGNSSAVPAFALGVAAKTGTLHVPAGSVVIGAFNTNIGTTGVTWAGLTEDTENSGTFAGAASGEFAVAELNHAITITCSGGVFGLAVAAWAPA